MLECLDLLIEYQKNPIGIDDEIPRFSWKIISERKGVMQKAYRIIVDGMWDSGMVESDESIHIEYRGSKLIPKQRYNVRIKVWDNYGEESKWLEGFFETGISKEQWTAKWLHPLNNNDVVPEFSKKFTVNEKIDSARLYATAYGLYEVYINRKRVSDNYFAPGFTSYKKRVQYQTYDIAQYLVEGENEISIYLAKGWCTGRYPFSRTTNVYDLKNSILAQLEINNSIVAATDNSWECKESKLRFSEIYDGEVYDNSFCKDIDVDFEIAEYNYENIIAQINEPVRVIESVKPKHLIITPKGEKVIDFGQNMVGRVQFSVHGKKGEKVILSHAEALDNSGNFYTDNLRTAKQKIEYILNGDDEEFYNSRMSFQGFRYIRLDEYPGEINLSDFEGQVLSSDTKRTGNFECSHELLNKLYENSIWSHKGNFIDIPTDCPQRDERAGWTGDIQVFCKTAVQNMNLILFFKKWLGDLRLDQREDGACLIIVPSMKETETSAGWGDAATVCPMEIYNAYGDKKVLIENFETMKKWVEYIKNCGDNPYLWNTGWQWGDWLSLDGVYGNMFGNTPVDLVASAFYAYSTQIVRDTAKILGKNEDYIKYSELHDRIIENINYEFVTPNGRMSANTQSAYVFALKFNLVKDKEKAISELVKLVKSADDRLTTGFLATPYLCDVLYENGYTEKAFDILLQEKYPSWLFSVKQGATTIWEHWDGIRPDGEFWDKGMNSFNHYAYGVIADFMYKKIGGITPTEPGYKKIQIKPVLDERIAYAKTSIETMYGKVLTDWKCDNGNFKIKINIPCNTEATVIMPDTEVYEVKSGSYEFECKYKEDV